MKRIDEKIKDRIEYETSDKANWLQNHTLSKEQVEQLILNKYNRAKKDHENLQKVKHLMFD